MKKENTTEMVDRIAAAGTVTEREINLIKRRLNDGEQADLSKIWDGEIELERSQVEKGYRWLKNLWVTPAGKERTNNPFGYREIEALKDPAGEKMYLAGFCNVGNKHQNFYVPLYRVISGAGWNFDYYVSGGGINIVG